MQISSTVLCRLPIHKASRNWFVTHLLYLNYLVNAVNYSSLKSSSGKCDYRQTDRHQTDRQTDISTSWVRPYYVRADQKSRKRGYGPPAFVCLACNINFMQKEDIFVSSFCEIFILTRPFTVLIFLWPCL